LKVKVICVNAVTAEVCISMAWHRSSLDNVMSSVICWRHPLLNMQIAF